MWYDKNLCYYIEVGFKWRWKSKNIHLSRWTIYPSNPSAQTKINPCKKIRNSNLTN
jgi:hypothetical protein